MTTFPLTVAVTPSALQVKPGASAQVTVTITNVSDIVEHYQVTLVGLPSNEYWTTEPAMTKLKPRGTGAIGVRITVPERGGLLGGRYVLGVLVSSPYQPDVARSADLVLEVGVVSGMELTATPMTATGKTEAAYAVSLTNDGNIDVPVDLVATDEHGKAEIRIDPASVYVRPGGAQAARVNVRAPGLLTGTERRSTITIKALAAGETRGQVQVSFIQTPRIAPVIFRTLGIVLAVAVIAGAIVIGGLVGRQEAGSGPSTNTAPPSPTQQTTQPTTPSGSVTTPPAQPTVSPITISPDTPAVDVDTVLTATASAGITKWLWDITGPDNFTKKDPTPQQLIIKFPLPGQYTIRLTVTDAGGQTAEAPELTVPVEPNAQGAEVFSTKIKIDPGQTVSNAAGCGEGLVAVGGGLDVVSDGAVPPPTVLQASIGTGSAGDLVQWTATVHNPSANQVDAEIKAVCMAKPDGYKVVTKDNVFVDAETTEVQQATCRRRARRPRWWRRHPVRHGDGHPEPPRGVDAGLGRQRRVDQVAGAGAQPRRERPSTERPGRLRRRARGV